MMMGKEFPLNTHYRAQLLVGLGLGIWLYFFLVLVGPFDAAEVPLRIRTILMIGYGLVFFLSYAILIPIQNTLYQYWGMWKLGHEIALIAVFCLYCLPLSFAYYKTDIVRGLFSFGKFVLTVYLPTIVILIPVIFVGRYLVGRNERQKPENAIREQAITLLGENKLDILKLPMKDLVAMEAANNYVAVYYVLNGELKKKLLRSSLRKLHKSVPGMVQVHRSYLVNAQHFVEWEDGQTLRLTQISVPISQKFKSALLAQSVFTPK